MEKNTKSVNLKTKEVVEGNTADLGQVIEQNAVNAPVKDVLWNANQINTESETHLEDDLGEGEAAIIRAFDFASNPEAFKEHIPSKQELFNHHYKGIEAMLWRDGMKVMSEVDPKIIISKNKKNYRIFVGARPQKGHILRERPQTLTQVTRNERGN